jgi:hypothetical protein
VRCRPDREIAEPCLAAVVARTFIEARIEAGHQWAGAAATLTRKVCVPEERALPPRLSSHPDHQHGQLYYPL